MIHIINIILAIKLSQPILKLLLIHITIIKIYIDYISLDLFKTFLSVI